MTAERLERWQHDAAHLSFADRPDILRLIQASEYAGRRLLSEPSIIDTIDSISCWPDFDFAAAIGALPDDEAAAMKHLRLSKHRCQTALIHARTNENLNEPDFLSAISRLASALVDAAHDWSFSTIEKRHGTPLDEDGRPMKMTILGMGKFGGGELNFSSDIDLIFAYRHSGETHAAAGQKSQDHEVFYRKLAQKLIAMLDSITEDGFVYRVDMRLRPFGQSGPLTLSYAALDAYYQLHGRDWERYAMMKARPVAGDIAGGEALLAELRPFMYRRYLDYPALAAIADMKEAINRQIRDSGMESHVKLGRGGIREAEFAVQAAQLIYGGQYPRLQSQNFLTALATLAELKLWPQEDAAALRDAYLTLRQIENALQYDQEQQTHQLPDSEAGWMRLTFATGSSSLAALQHALREARKIIHRKFNATVAPQAPSAPTGKAFSGIDWHDPLPISLARALECLEYPETELNALVEILTAAAADIPWQRLPKQTLEPLEKLLPLIAELTASEPYPPAAADGVLALIREVLGRSVYIRLLAEQPKLLRHLLAIARDSAWLINFIRQHPLVLDDILSERERIADPAQLKTDLAARLQNLDGEEWLNALRDFKHAQVFKIAWAEVHGNLPLMHASDNLSLLAEEILATALARTSQELSLRHGIPRTAGGDAAQFAIIAYGKLGGLELSYGSDLDLVFLYDDGRSQGSTDGSKPIANQQYFTRLVQRLNNTLTAASTSGILYETDTRLRPGGSSGMLISSIESFEEYQQKQAWTWEHQALTRARAICGSAELMEKFTAVRHKILTAAPKPDLRQQVADMRAKMLAAHKPPADAFHLKKSRGGLIDIEFIVQYLLLAHAYEEPILIRMTDNIRQLAALEASGILSSFEAMTLRDLYRQLRGEAHRRYLNNQDNIVPAEQWQNTADCVMRIWERIFDEKE